MKLRNKIRAKTAKQEESRKVQRETSRLDQGSQGVNSRKVETPENTTQLEINRLEDEKKARRRREEGA